MRMSFGSVSGAREFRGGQVLVNETVAEGFSSIVDAFIGMLRGENVGKMLVRV